MSRYIDADYVLVEAENIFSDMGDYGWLKRIFENPSAPSIDIVHCINCKFCSERGGHANCNGYLYCTRQKMLVDETCYCSWGEER